MPATLSDKVLLVPNLSYVLGRTLVSLLGSPFRGSDGAPTVAEHVQGTAFRALFKCLSTGQLQ